MPLPACDNPDPALPPKGVDILVGRNLRRLRQAAGISCAALAAACGLDEAALASVEAGAHFPAAALLFALRHLGERPIALFRDAPATVPDVVDLQTLRRPDRG